MDLVIDIQCLKNAKNDSAPKEIPLVALNGDFHTHWLVSPMTYEDNLSDEKLEEKNN